MKIISTADLHYDRDRQAEFFSSANALLDAAKFHTPDLITIAGDIFDRATNNTRSSGFPELIEWFRDLASIAPVAVIYGTPTHDIPGSLDFLERIEARHDIVICRPNQTFVLDDDNVVTPFEAENPRLLILGIPEVSKGWLLANKDDLSGDTTEAVKGAMRSYLLGLAAIRQEFSSIPCVVLYHGAIRGARLSDTQTLPPGGIEVGIDDLAQIGADYYSCGHIHMRQDLPGLPGRYEGSIYPKTWGELEQKAFSVVEFGGDQEAVNYPHPPRKKMSVKIGDEISEEDVAGYQVWVEKTVPAGTPVDTGTALEYLYKLGALSGSRYTTRTTHDETTRAKEITEATSTYGKVRVWAENTGVAIPADTEEKIHALDAESERKGLLHQPRRWRLDRLELRGAIGLWKGQKKEEVVIDFENLDPGTIALLGDNGAGKSTIVKNCNPYPEPIGGERKYQDLFYLRDSYSATYWTDMVSGLKYKAIKQIDGKNSSGKAEFFLYRLNGSGWEPYDEEATSGRKAGYEAAVMELFGTPEIFTRSAYIAQGGADMPNTPKGRKEFFNELLGNEYLEVMSQSAKSRADGIEREIDSTTGRIEGLRYGLDQDGVLLTTKTVKTIEMEEEKATLRGLEESGKLAKEQLETLKKEQQENESIRHQIRTLEGTISDTRNQIAGLEKQIVSFKETLQGIPAAEKALADDEERRAELERAQSDKAALEARNLEARERHAQALEAVRLKRAEAREAYDEADARVKSIDLDIKALESEKSALEQKKTVIDTPCPKCGYLAPNVAAQLLYIDERLEEIVGDLSHAHEEMSMALTEKAATSEELEAIIDPEPPEYETYIMPEIEALSPEQRHALQNKIEAGRNATAQIDAKEEQIRQLKEKLNTTRGDLEAAKAQEDVFIDGKVKEAEKEYEALRESYSSCSGSIKALEAEITGLEKQLADIEKRREEIKRLEDEIGTKRTDLDTWRFIQKALGRDGVQALELDALAPSIAEVANRLLQRAYGPRFEIEFRTTRDAGTGKNRHQVEDFEIYVHDHEEAEPSLQVQTLGTMSGGERVWIMKALCDAFGIVREKNTGLQYMTTFQDEADGALSPEKKHLYLQMVEAAHAESGRHHTVYITHDSGIQDAIPQQIKVSEL
jgi:DNA repair exonuclease SbcCD ATPase subunit/DNA repair exonuclease SbcCD nuclease subunit